MYKIGNQTLLIAEIFSVGQLFIFDGCTLYLDIYSKFGAKVHVVFSALKTDNCSSMSAPSKTFMDRSISELELLIKEVEKLQA